MNKQAGHVPARLVRRAAVHEPVRPRRPRLLRLSGDQLEVGAGLARRPDRRLHALEGPEEPTPTPRRCSPTSAAQRRRTRTSPPTRTTSARTRGRARVHYSALQKKAAEHDRVGEAHRPVHGPRHAAGLRLHGDDPVAAVLPQQPQQRQLAGGEHPEAEGGDLRRPELDASGTGGDRGSSTARSTTDGAPPEEARRPSFPVGPDRARPDGRHPGADRVASSSGSRPSPRSSSRSRTGTGSAGSARSTSSGRATTTRSRRSTRRSGPRSGTTSTGSSSWP